MENKQELRQRNQSAQSNDSHLKPVLGPGFLPLPYSNMGLERLMAGLLDDPTFNKPSVLIPFCCSMFSFSITCGFAVLHAWASAAYCAGSCVNAMVLALSIWNMPHFGTTSLFFLLIFGTITGVIGLFGMIGFGTLGHANDEGISNVTSRNIAAFWAFVVLLWSLALIWATLRPLRRKLYKEKTDRDRT